MGIPVVLSVAGSDSGGGAGIQADIKTFHALGVHGACAVTSVTSQNTLGVQGRFDLPAPVVLSQMEAVFSDMEVAAVKTGMLATAEVVRAVGDELRRRGAPNLVVDPVVISSSGNRLLEEDGWVALTEYLLPLATVFTPNLAEASLLLGLEVRDPGEMREAVRRLADLGPACVVLKGGHLEGGRAVDVFYDGERLLELEAERVDTADDHGTGCVFSAAVAAYLALGKEPREAVKWAKDLVTAALRGSIRLGRGKGPVNPPAVPRDRPRDEARRREKEERRL